MTKGRFSASGGHRAKVAVTPRYTVPLNFMLSQMLKIGNQPISLQLGYRYYADAPKGGPDWGLRFSLTLLFPKEH